MSHAHAALSTLVVALMLPFLLPADASAIPAFARKYGVSCNLCHSTVPRLNAYGEHFAGNGFELVVGEAARDTLDTASTSPATASSSSWARRRVTRSTRATRCSD